jgi:hypothetical protein
MARRASDRLRTIVYVDGFNLYYGCLKDSAERWLDVGALCERMLSSDSDIVGIKYFTARVKVRPGNPHAGQRQQTYFRALATVPNLTIHYGRFLERAATRRCVKDDNRGRARFVEVWETEEKGSDVNLASHLLIDGWRARYDLAVVISNDSDLKEPVRLVREELNAPVGVLNPHGNRSWALSPKQLPRGSFYKPIRRAALRASQFPIQVPDASGIVHKPTSW